jgi:hypothetical protein
VSSQLVYRINTGLEMLITDEFVVKFKKGIDSNQQKAIHEKHGANIIKVADTYLLMRVPRNVSALDIANQYQESDLVEFAHPNF